MAPRDRGARHRDAERLPRGSGGDCRRSSPSWPLRCEGLERSPESRADACFGRSDLSLFPRSVDLFWKVTSFQPPRTASLPAPLGPAVYVAQIADIRYPGVEQYGIERGTHSAGTEADCAQSVCASAEELARGLTEPVQAIASVSSLALKKRAANSSSADCFFEGQRDIPVIAHSGPAAACWPLSISRTTMSAPSDLPGSAIGRAGGV